MILLKRTSSVKRGKAKTMQTKQGNCQSRRTLLRGLTAAGGAAFLGPSMPANAWGQEGVDPRVAKIVEDTISLDMHNHDGQPTFAKAPADRKPDPTGVNLPGEMKKAGLSAICLTYAVDIYRTRRRRATGICFISSALNMMTGCWQKATCAGR